MARVLRLKTFVDTADTEEDPASSHRMSVSACLEAVLADGRRIVLLGDRGWSGKRSDGGDPWEFVSVEEIQRAARTVVGPDEPPEGRSGADTDAQYWDALAQTLRQEGFEVAGADLTAVPHEVELSDRVLQRIGRQRP